MLRNIYAKIDEQYEKKRKAAADALQLKLNEVYSKIPAIEEMDHQINLLGIQANKKLLLGTGNKELIVDEMSRTIEQISLKKAELLYNAGYPENYLKIQYECMKCFDAGYISSTSGDERCSCMKQQIINQLYQQSNLHLCETDNFSSFNEEFYSDVVDEKRFGLSISPRENIRNINEGCNRFIENFASPDEKNLYFSGPVGTGKTFMSSCIADVLIKMGRTVLYYSSPALFDIISGFKRKSFKDENYDETIYRSIFEVDLLIIDDLGTESQSESRYAELLNILNTRQQNDLQRPCKTIISTNVDARELFGYYTERVMSRIKGYFNPYRFAGDDIRRVRQ